MKIQKTACICMLFFIFMSGYTDETAAPASDFAYHKNSAGNGIIISEYIGEGGDIVVPASIEGLPVVKIETFTQEPTQQYNSYGGIEYDYSNIPDIYSIVFPATITEFGENFYCAGKRIRRIVLPKKVKNIPDFSSYENLTDIVMPEYAETMSSLSYCKKLKKIILPHGLKELKDYAFSGCKNLETIILPDTLTKIGIYTFADCPKLKEITFPKTLKSIGIWAFSECGGLEKVVLSAHNIKYDGDVFSGCYSLSIAVQKQLRNSGYTGTFRKR